MSHEEQLELLQKIAKVNYKLSDENFLKSVSGDVLSYIGVKLAAMKASIVDLKVDAQKDMLEKEVLKDAAKAAAFLKAKKEHNATSAADAKYGDEDFQAATREYNEAKVLFDQLKSIVADTHDTIDDIKSRVIDLQGARKDERLG
jgi:hypothetical protein